MKTSELDEIHSKLEDIEDYVTSLKDRIPDLSLQVSQATKIKEEYSKRMLDVEKSLNDVITKISVMAAQSNTSDEYERLKHLHNDYVNTFNSTITDLIEQGAYDVARLYINFLESKHKVQVPARPADRKEEAIKKDKAIKKEEEKHE